MENQKTQLDKIWGNDMTKLPPWVKERGYCYAVNTEQKDLLITGMNPSFNEKIDKNGHLPYKFIDSIGDGKLDSDYWRNMRKMVSDEVPGINLRDRAAYLDIFYFRKTKQSEIYDELIRLEETNKWREFAGDQLKLTQNTIEEVIKPKLFVVANKGSYAYWGKEKKFIWMGYTFDDIKETDYGTLCKITGLPQHSDRINKDLESTCLEGALVLFSEFPAAGQPSAAFMQALLAQA
jgi:hypothetical protein